MQLGHLDLPHVVENSVPIGRALEFGIVVQQVAGDRVTVREQGIDELGCDFLVDAPDLPLSFGLQY
jgi:hypothetical protein